MVPMWNMVSVRNMSLFWLYHLTPDPRSPRDYRRISLWVYEEADEDHVRLTRNLVFHH